MPNAPKKGLCSLCKITLCKFLCFIIWLSFYEWAALYGDKISRFRGLHEEDRAGLSDSFVIGS